MYKVFINDKPIILTSSLEKENDLPVLLFKNTVIDEILYKLNKENYPGFILYSTNLEKDWPTFLSNFKVISAAGGLVLNKKKEILFIYRGNKWDLPKGRIEEGESIEHTAVREVEECGIENLSIERFLVTTYHLFFHNNRNYLKETHWFLMKTDFKGELTPQLEEGITETIFKNTEEAKNAFKNSYSNILLVYNEYLKTK